MFKEDHRPAAVRGFAIQADTQRTGPTDLASTNPEIARLEADNDLLRAVHDALCGLLTIARNALERDSLRRPGYHHDTIAKIDAHLVATAPEGTLGHGSELFHGSVEELFESTETRYESID